MHAVTARPPGTQTQRNRVGSMTWLNITRKIATLMNQPTILSSDARCTRDSRTVTGRIPQLIGLNGTC